jgi:zinc protease
VIVLRIRVLACLIAIAACGVPAAAQEIRLNVVPYRLENGLKVLVLEDHGVPAVSYYTFFRVGSRNEQPGRTGLSHLFEHLMFGGTPRHGAGDFDTAIESRGGESNAFTSEDMTVYHESFPSEALPLVVGLEADRMAGLRLTAESLASEREVVKEERRASTDESLEGALFEALQATAYAAHPYQWPVIGWPADLDAITVADLEAYFRIHYAPNNATVVVVGDVKPDRAIALIGDAYKSIPPQKPAPAVVRNEPSQEGERRVILRRPAQLPAVAIAWHIPGTDSPDVFALDLAEVILGQGDSSRLHRALVIEKELATTVGVISDRRIDPSIFFLYAEARPGVEVADLEAAIHDQIAAFVAAGPGEPEVRKAKNTATVSLVRSLKTNSGKAEQIGMFETYFGSHTRLFSAPRDYETLTAADVKRVAARYLVPDNRTVGVLVPRPEAAAPPGGGPGGGAAPAGGGGR